MSTSEEGIEKTADKNGKEIGIVTRPKASAGFWLCILLPSAFMVNNLRYPYNSLDFEYKVTTITAFGLFLQSLTIFYELSCYSPRFIKVMFNLLPGATTSFFYTVCLRQPHSISFFWGYVNTLFYYYAYFRILQACPKSFTFGEASIVTQGLVLFLLNAILQVPAFIQNPPTTPFLQMNAIMMAAILCLALTAWAIYRIKLLRNVYLFYPLMLALIQAVCLIPVTEDFPVVVLFNFITANLKRVFVIIFYLGLVGVTISTVGWQMDKKEQASTRTRKIFHFLIVSVYIPGLLYECTLLYIASGIIFSLFVVLEIIRLAEVPPFAEYIQKSVSAFIDDKDAGKLVLTPFYLLIACSLPMWIAPAVCMTTDSVGVHLLPMLSGVISIGIGDSVASIFGSKFGRHRWRASTKSIEGTLVSIICQGLTVAIFNFLGYVTLSQFNMLAASVAILVSSIAEAITDQVDNLVLPLIFYIFVSS